jgi:hypothetical protein
LNRSPILALALLLTAAPACAFAQARPATVIAGAPRMAAQMPALVVVREDSRLARQQTTIPPTQPPPALRLIAARTDVPVVEIRAKDEWFADEGLQVRGSKVAFKRRF